MSATARPDIFLDSSALIAGVISSTGASRALLLLAEAEIITLTVSEQVIVESERSLSRKVPQALPYYHNTLSRAASGLCQIHPQKTCKPI